MCGICGVIQVGGEPRPVVAPEVLDRMTDVMTHRGPNDRGVFRDAGAALGVRRLSIIDVEAGHQPFTDERGVVWAAQNGELYNHNELRHELTRQGHKFATRCDTEILPHLYERSGIDVPKYLRGKFAIAIWDSERRRAILARDRLGIKPLYFAVRGDLLVFGSELKSVLASGLIEPELDYHAIHAYLTLGYFARASTPLRGVSKLLPGERLVVEDESIKMDSYWELPYPGTSHSTVPAREYAEGLMAELDEAVRLRLMSDVPVGAMLSGGLDSSVVVALMARHATEPIRTFSVAFTEDVTGNELADARLVASAFGTRHQELELSFADEAVPLEDLVWHLDEPLADLSALGFHALSKVAAQEVSVALAGQGADELLGGYPTHRNAAAGEAWLHAPKAVRSAAKPLIRRMPSRLRGAAAAATAEDPVTKFLVQTSKLSAELRSQLLIGPLAAVTSDPAREIVTECAYHPDAGVHPLASTLYIHQKLGLVDDMLHYFDRASMAHSLDVRVPFLDHRVVEYCATIPNDLKVRRLTGKHILRLAARDLIPDAIIDKPKVGFFSHAVSSWFKQQTRTSMADYLLQPTPAYGEILDQKIVSRLIDAHAAGRAQRHTNLLLAILMLEIWLSSFLPRAVGSLHTTSQARAA